MNTVKCPHCGEQTLDVESGMGYITCEGCGKEFSSNKGYYALGVLADGTVIEQDLHLKKSETI